jgi:hypothetical protein
MMIDQTEFANEFIARQTKMIQELTSKVILLDTQLALTNRKLQEYVVLEEDGQVDTSGYDNAEMNEDGSTPESPDKKNN